MRWLKKSTKPELPERLAALQGWMRSGTGAHILNTERCQIEHELNYIFGYHSVEMSISPDRHLLANSQVSRNFRFHPVTDGELSSLMVDPNHWPVSPGSLDLVLLHHMIEISDRPHRLLSEAGHTIIPGGKMIIVGFNPASVISGARFILPSYRKLFSGIQLIGPARMRDWLTLLGFSVEKVFHGSYLLPSNHSSKGLGAELVEQRCNNWMLPFGGFYIMVATREVPGMIPVKPSWSAVGRPIVGNPITGSSRVGDNR
jgi:SAM-dependent methyltransferase